ncbi:hypothetical protein GQR58_003291 [Nymphon striatum]|nr:hypothetical protein GQR58_003291 [Nymphon striatum]
MYKLLLTFLLLLTVNAIHAAEVKAFLNQESFYEGDPITLTIESSGNSVSSNNGAEPDLTPLSKDFQILGTSTSTQINILNGHQRSKRSWTIELQPQKKGKLQIPEIHIGQDKTLPVDLEITEIPADIKEETSKHIFVESSIDIAGEQPYVQQQIPYTVKLFYDNTMQSGKIYSPTVENAVVEQLGEDRRYRTLRMGKKYSVVEKHFVISPEKSGTLHIPPTSVKGRLTITENNNQKRRRRNNNGDSTDFMNRFLNNSPFGNDPFFKDFGDSFFSGRRAASKPFTAQSEEINVEVQPLPKAFTGNLWLPAEELLIEDSWSKSPPELRVGEPVTRTLRLQAKGLAGSQIPKIEVPKPSSIRIYPEQAKSETRTDGKTVYGISEMNISYIPDAQGQVTIPEIKLDWWNVVTKKQETFTLPKWDLNVAPGAVGQKPAESLGNAGLDTKQEATSQNSNSMAQLPNDSSSSTTESTSDNTLIWLLSILVFILLGMISYLNYFKPKYFKLGKNTSNKSKEKTDKIKVALKQACASNNQHEAAKHLLAFVKATWKGGNTPQNLGSLALQVSQGEGEIQTLEQSLYAKDTVQWDGLPLWNVVKDGLRIKTKSMKVQKTGLKPLYPSL